MSQLPNERIKGPIIVWVNYGYEGWQPESFESVKTALLAPRYGSEFVITKLVDFDTTEK